MRFIRVIRYDAVHRDPRRLGRASGGIMRRLFAQLTIFAVTAFAIGVGYRYLWDEPSQASVANYLRSGARAMGLATCGLGAHFYFNAHLSKRLRRWPLLAENRLASGGDGDRGLNGRDRPAGGAL
jgi:hypothetical protein